MEENRIRETVPVAPCVVVYHSFDINDLAVYECDDDEQADELVERLHATYLEEERTNNSYIREDECVFYKEDGWGQIVWDNGAFTRFVKTYSIKEV